MAIFPSVSHEIHGFGGRVVCCLAVWAFSARLSCKNASRELWRRRWLMPFWRMPGTKCSFSGFLGAPRSGPGQKLVFEGGSKKVDFLLQFSLENCFFGLGAPRGSLAAGGGSETLGFCRGGLGRLCSGWSGVHFWRVLRRFGMSRLQDAGVSYILKNPVRVLR